MTWSDVVLIVQTIAFTLIAGALIVLAVGLARFLRILAEIESALNRFAEGTRPILENGRVISEDLRAVSARLREEAEHLGGLAHRSVEGLEETIEVAGQRLSRLNELLEMLQNEMEGALIGVVSFARGVRVGASVLRRRRKRRAAGDGDE